MERRMLMGHLKRKGRKKYEICIEVGRNPRTGKRQRKYKTVNNVTKQEAQKIMHEMMQKYNSNQGFIDPDKITVGQYLEEWLVEYAKNNVSQKTFVSYKAIINNHLIPYLGKLKIGNLYSRHIIKYQNEKLENGRLDGNGGLSKRTVQYHHRVLSQALKHAVHTYHILDSNPCDAVKAPNPEQPEIHPLTKKEAKQLLKRIKGDLTFFTLVHTALYTGLRRGELFALRWKDIDLDNKVMHVKQAVSEVAGEELIYKEPKTDSSKRRVDFDQDVAANLKYFLKKQFKYYGQDELVFLNRNGNKIRLDYITKRFKKEVRKLGLENTRFHDLRHTHATWLLKANVNPKIVQERLGHKKISTTLDRYSHVIPSMQKEAVEKLKNTEG